MTKFRVGDVVTWVGSALHGRPAGMEYRVVETRKGEFGSWFVDTGPGGALDVEKHFSLLRRPVRVGDVLRVAGTTATFPAEADALAAGGYRSPWFEHSCGAAIDPPQAEGATEDDEFRMRSFMNVTFDRPAFERMLVFGEPYPDAATQGAGTMAEAQITCTICGTTRSRDGAYYHRGIEGLACSRCCADVLRTRTPILPTVEQLARALARVLDEEFARFVDERSEVGDKAGPFEGGFERHERTWTLAWERDELGARSRWTQAAQRTLNILDVLRGGGR